jgi:guanosine-3',5'-bis(diphosphate) 3'-pyrophosphohydrolase
VELVERARKFALETYGSESELEHPCEVAELVARAGGSEELQAAAVLHDLIEDTDVEIDAIEQEFGPEVARCVAAMTEDDSIRTYLAVKKEHRERARDAGREVSLLFVADKLSNARRMRRGAKRARARKIGHYATTLELMRESYPDLPLLDELETELDAVRAELQHSPA